MTGGPPGPPGAPGIPRGIPWKGVTLAGAFVVRGAGVATVVGVFRELLFTVIGTAVPSATLTASCALWPVAPVTVTAQPPYASAVGVTVIVDPEIATVALPLHVFVCENVPV
jgi:hypothetical protein